MTLDILKFERSIRACVNRSRELLEDAEWLTNRSSTGLALAVLAQEEAAKAFILTLVRDGILPWTPEVRHSLFSHNCKHLITIAMEWLWNLSERRFAELPAPTWDDSFDHLPPEVATAINIYRHEEIERRLRGHSEHVAEWSGPARKIADGQRDRRKQAALYVGIRADGDVESLPPTSSTGFETEFARAKVVLDCATSGAPLASSEFCFFSTVLKAVFKDLALGPEDLALLEREVPSGIPGIRFVERTITVANIVADPEPPLET